MNYGYDALEEVFRHQGKTQTQVQADIQKFFELFNKEEWSMDYTLALLSMLKHTAFVKMVRTERDDYDA